MVNSTLKTATFLFFEGKPWATPRRSHSTQAEKSHTKKFFNFDHMVLKLAGAA